MAGTIQKLLLRTSLLTSSLVSIGAIAPASLVMAASITNASVIGRNGLDYYIYEKVGLNTVRNDNASLASILQGSCPVNALNACDPAGSPGGNVELFANSEQPSPLSPPANATFDQSFFAFNKFLYYTTTTVLTGQLGTKNITLSSLTGIDWFEEAAVNTAKAAINTAFTIGNPAARLAALNAAITPLYGSNFASQWFNAALTNYGVAPNQFLFNAFLLAGGFQRFSDPNISYVNQDPNGLVRIGLAGHYDAATLLGFTPNPNRPIQASEIVKVSYDNQNPVLLYSFRASLSGLFARDDRNSHTGNYEVTLQGDPVPEPATILGTLGALGAGYMLKRKQKKQDSANSYSKARVS